MKPISLIVAWIIVARVKHGRDFVGQFWRSLLLAVVTVVAISDTQAAQPAESNFDMRLRATVVYRLARYVTWKEGAFANETSPIVIGVLGNEGVARVLGEVSKDKSSKSRKFETRTIKTANDAKGCHVLFIPTSEKANLTKILSTLSEQQVFTVSDMEGFARKGGMVQFRVFRGMLRFEINRNAMSAAGLKISSRLLRFSRIVPLQINKERR